MNYMPLLYLQLIMSQNHRYLYHTFRDQDQGLDDFQYISDSNRMKNDENEPILPILALKSACSSLVCKRAQLLLGSHYRPPLARTRRSDTFTFQNKGVVHLYSGYFVKINHIAASGIK